MELIVLICEFMDQREEVGEADGGSEPAARLWEGMGLPESFACALPCEAEFHGRGWSGEEGTKRLGIQAL